MSLLSLPPEIIYDILGEVVASYIEKAITSPPVDGWETMDSEGESEWYTDDDDANADSDSSDMDEDVEYNPYDTSDEDMSDSSDELDDEDMEDSDEDAPFSDTSDESLAFAPALDDDLEGRKPTAFNEGSRAPPLEGAIITADSGNDLDNDASSMIPDDVLSLWMLEQEQTFGSDDALAFKLFLWDTMERREKLPTNDIASLLSVCHTVREVTLKLVSDALGYDHAPNESVDYNPWSLLRHIRRHYRVSHTQPFELPKTEYPARITPLVQCYYLLSGLGHTLRHLSRLVHMDPAGSCATVKNILDLVKMANCIPQLVFRPRIAYRVHVFLVHLRRYISVSMYCADISQSYKEMFSIAGTSRRPAFVIHEVRVLDLV
ncbi:hypothetical protein BDN70DRAFT_25432 [Pholiota conissans]|uniref:Uncharacterized protein n=1 Tax=Pholiota conissans TaxID=109636 RepID=A0A9P5ZDD5_9AGAR|nr:hypothetical protein BDN70DRAFT_25432 [Pholiota conissans]